MPTLLFFCGFECALTICFTVLSGSENFLKQGKDENAVLSIGYADGLVDALRMAKGIEPKM